MTQLTPLHADLPSNLSPKLLAVLQHLALDSYILRELWWYAIILMMIDDEAVSVRFEQEFNGRNWIHLYSRAGDEFCLPKPPLSPEQELQLLRTVREITDTQDDCLTLYSLDSPWQTLEPILLEA